MKATAHDLNGYRILKHRGLDLAYRLEGEGPLVVLVQGLAFPGKMWLTLPGTLVDLGYRVLVPDNRGSGLSAKPWRPYRMKTMAAELAAVIREVQEAPALVVGISLGGMIAQHLAIDHPDRVSGLVLAATTCGHPFGKLANPLGLIPMLRFALGPKQIDKGLKHVLVHPSSRKGDPELFKNWDRVLAESHRSVIGTIGQLMAAVTHNTYFGLGRISCPTMVITGDSDRLIPPANSKILARRIPGAELRVVPRAGHAFPLEYPEVMPEAVQRIVERSSN